MNWDYSDHPQRSLITKRCERLGAALLATPNQFDRSECRTTLRAHKYVFRQFTPVGYPYYAGNYRGGNYPILQDYRVGIAIDPKVGENPKYVKKQMELFDKQFNKTIESFEKQFNEPNSDRGLLLLKLAEILGTFLVRFLTIHPYVNGNGHMGRVLVLRMLGRLGIWPANWMIDERPPYDAAIYAHRRGNTGPLTTVMLRCILG